MTTTSILAKIGAMAATVAAPAMLFLGAGTAQASMSASAMPAPGGVDVLVTTWPNAAGGSAPSGWCTFNSSVVGNPIGKPLPAINVPFYLPETGPGAGTKSRLWFPSYPTGSTWNISVECPNAAPQVSQLVW
jgi:ribulose 1,5-bisphosphate synthetase/thiazole synthase